MATDPSTVDLHGSASRRPSAETHFLFAKEMPACRRTARRTVGQHGPFASPDYAGAAESYQGRDGLCKPKPLPAQPQTTSLAA